jgi:UDP-N-acetylmuramoyl-tripeptide--D-alanyl-D-alanine ligase
VKKGAPAARPAEGDAAPDLTVRDVVKITAGVVVQGDERAVVRGAAIDSRAVRPGMLFVALPGERTDGHRFVEEAYRRGAAAALVSREVSPVLPGASLIRVPDTLRAFHRLARAVRDRQALRVVGITGSVGKTSTKEMAFDVLTRAYRAARSPENWNTEIGIPLVLTNIPRDREVAIVELAMRGPGQIRELVEICRPEIGVVTNIGISHMEFFESQEQLAATKGELLEGLPPDGVAIVNADDPLAWGLLRRTAATPLTFGLERGDVTAENVRVLPAEGSAFRLRIPRGRSEVRLRTPGRHAIQNALAAAAIGAAFGLPVDEIAEGLSRAGSLGMRLAARRIGEATVLDDVYNSSPQSVEAALDVMDQVAGSPRIAVLGDMKELGSLSLEAHRRVGRMVAERRMDLVVAFGPLARDLAAGAATAGARVAHTTDPGEVMSILRREMLPGAVVLVKGSRAMEMERIVGALEDHLTQGTGRAVRRQNARGGPRAGAQASRPGPRQTA